MPRLEPGSGKIKWYRSDGAVAVYSALISILIGMAVGAVIVVVVGLLKSNISTTGIWEGVRLVFLGVFSTGRSGSQLSFGFNAVNMGNMLFRAVPLIMTGLSVAVAFKTGLFNIGAAGQYLMGTMGTLSVGLWLGWAGVPTFIAWICAFLAGVILGGLWGAIPGLFKAFLNINEVITCIMTNWIAANLVTWWFDSHEMFKNSAEGGKIGYVIPLKNVGVVTPKMFMDVLFKGSQANGGFWIAVIIAIAMWIMMTKTTFGYELRACGANRHAAKYAGINDKKNIILSMAIAGCLAAAGASLYYLSGNTEFYWSTYQKLPAEGFNGIPVALLAANHPIGVIFSGIFMSMLNISGIQLKYLTAYNEYISDIIIAVIVYLSAFSMLFKTVLSKKIKKGTGGNVNDEPAPAQVAATPAEQNAQEEKEIIQNTNDFEEDILEDYKQLFDQNAEIAEAESEEGGQK
ncbi:MAG: ABC transporter permease [Firmicutes bacterium]|nr:ABC transporter permease [Bacillota bacterium]